MAPDLDVRSSDIPKPEAAVRDHLANERTLLAWQRTALAIVAIGFLVDRLAIRCRRLDRRGFAPWHRADRTRCRSLRPGASPFVRTEHEIDTQSYQPAIRAHLVLTAAIVLGAVALMIFTVTTPR